MARRARRQRGPPSASLLHPEDAQAALKVQTIPTVAGWSTNRWFTNRKTAVSSEAQHARARPHAHDPDAGRWSDAHGHIDDRSPRAGHHGAPTLLVAFVAWWLVRPAPGSIRRCISSLV